METISSFLAYGLMSLFLAGAVSIAMYPVGEFIAISFVSLLVYGRVSGQCSSLLFAQKELHVFGALPISASTHLASKISGTIAFESLVCSALMAPTVLVILIQHGLVSGVRWVVSVAFCVLFFCFVAIAIHSFLARTYPGVRSEFRLLKSILWTSLSAIFLVIWIWYLLPTFELSEFGESWNLDGNPLLLLFPPYWFIALLLFLDGQINTTTLAGTLFAIFGSVPMCLYLFRRINAAFLETLSAAPSHGNKTTRLRRSKAPSKWRKIGSLGYERVAMWKLAFSHLKNDATFRTFWVAYIPMVFVISGIILVINTEPLDEPISIAAHAWLLTWSCGVMFFYAFLLYEATRTSDYAPASWVLFVSPSNHTRLAAMVVDWIFVLFVLPSLLLFNLFLSYILHSPIDALLHTIALGWLSYAAINLKSIVNPILPFARQTSGLRSTPRLCLNFLLVVVASVVISNTLASWIFTDYMTYGSSIVLGVSICVAVRLLAGVRYDRKFQNADLIA